MKNNKVSMLGLELLVAVPETIEEFDTLAGKPGAALASAIANEIYRGVLTEARSEFCGLLEDYSGIPRATKESGRTRKKDDGSTEPVLVFAETEADYVKRVIAELTVKANNGKPTDQQVEEIPWKSEFAPLVARLSVGGDKEVKFDPKATERKSNKIEKRFLDGADNIIAQGRVQDWIAKWGGDGSKDAIALKLKELVEEQERQKPLANQFL